MCIYVYICTYRHTCIYIVYFTLAAILTTKKQAVGFY